MPVKAIYILTLFTFLTHTVYSQNAKLIDSLVTTLATTKPDTSHVETYIDLYVRYSRTNLNLAIEYALKGRALAEKLNYTKGIANTSFRLGVAYTNLRDFTMAEKEFNYSLSFSELLNDTIEIASGYSGLANIYIERNEFDKAASAYLKALELLEATNDRNSVARILNYLGTLYKRQRQFDKALTYYEDALSIVRQLNFKPGISSCLTNIGSLYIESKEYDKALSYLTESLVIKREIGDKLGEGRTLLNIGTIHRNLKKYDLAHDHYIQSLTLAKEVVNPKDINIILFNLSVNELNRNDFEKSLQYSKESWEQSLINRDLEMNIKSQDIMAKTYDRLGQPGKAYEHARNIKTLSDSLYDEKIITLSTELESRYQNEKKEKEITSLNAMNQLSTLQLQKRDRERAYLIALTLLILSLGAVVWSRYRIKAKSNEKLKELDRAKSRFFTNISHEFRTPLTLISGGLDDLANGEEKSDDDKVELAIMQKNTKRLQQLIDQLLDLSKLESGKLSLGVMPTNPGNFLRSVTSSFSSWAEQKKITLTIDLPEQDVIVYFDEDVLEKIITNLLSNAIKFTPPLGKVSVSAQWNTEQMKIQISDTGIGIPSSKLTQIFERFYQADDSSSRTQEGSGIGLALVKELVALHHGQVTADSQPDEGTVFNVTIPIHKKHYSAPEIRSTQKRDTHKDIVIKDTPAETYPEFEEPMPNSPIVLVVEDNIDLAHYIGDHLPEYKIILAGNGVEGFAKAIEHVPDMIISDVMMPEMDGVEFCMKVKEDEKTSHIPVILLTAKADIESRLEGLETGADDYMTKPFNALELQTRVKNLILQRQKLRERFSRTVILKPRDIAITSPDEIFLEKVMAIVENYLGDAEFSVEDFQKEIGMSRMQLHRKLKALTGHSAGEFLRIQRLIRAGEMLTTTHYNISEVCYQTGFSSLSYFARCFKRQFGVTPKEYATQHSQMHE